MPTEVTVDTSQFDGALTLYLSMTSKSTYDALNGKMRDLMYHAVKYTPIANHGSAASRGVRNTRALAVYRRSKSGQPFTSADVDKSMQKIEKPSRGYMKSAFAKAGNYFKASLATTATKPNDLGKHMTRAEITLAVESMLSAAAKCLWPSRNEKDKDQKQAIVDKAFQEALTWVTLDMFKYFKSKQESLAKMVSAK